MKYWTGILFSLLHISVFAQEYRDAKSWINDIVNSELKPSGDLMEYEYSYASLVPPVWKPMDKWVIEGGNFRSKTAFYLKNHIQMDFKAEYKLTDRLSINLSDYHSVNDYRNQTITPAMLYKYETETNLSYNITRNFKIKTGMQYVYNIAIGQWEYMYLTGFTFTF